MSLANAPWPPGITARYLTAGLATVDIAEPVHHDATYGAHLHDYTSARVDVEAACTGCPARETFTRPIGSSGDKGAGQATASARDWAQEHASICRAMLRPEVTE